MIPIVRVSFKKPKTKCFSCAQYYEKIHNCSRQKKIVKPLYHFHCPASSDGKRDIRIGLDGVCFRCGQFFSDVKKKYDEVLNK